jgi:alpha/beta superfamily hydrolase
MQEQAIQLTAENRLEGRFFPGVPAQGRLPGAVVLCHPHPLYGGDMDNHIVVSVAQNCAAHGLTTLRFNFRGVGDSEGRFADGVGEVLDLKAALEWLRDQLGPDVPLGLVGYSFGSLVAARHVAMQATPPVTALALIAFTIRWPLIRPADYFGLGDYGGAILTICGNRDDLAPPDAVRAYFSQLEGMHGRVLATTLDGADHSFSGFTQSVGQAVAAFMRAMFAAQPADAP